MTDYLNTTPDGEHAGLTALGSAMPEVIKVPVLTQVETVSQTADSDQATSASSKADKLCMIEEGLTFTGNVTLQGPCTIAGHILGNLGEQANATSQIVITETGSVEGDIFSHKVSVMGRYSGTIDASGGSVDLHAKSVVSGHIRYGQLQVNGADLNATLERVANPSQAKPSRY